jgi:hypothetical protein
VAWAYPGPRAFFLSSHRVSWCAAVSPCIAGPGELGDRERHVPGRPLDGRAEQGGQQQAVPIVFLADDQQVGTDVAFEGGCGGGPDLDCLPQPSLYNWLGIGPLAGAGGERCGGWMGREISGRVRVEGFRWWVLSAARQRPDGRDPFPPAAGWQRGDPDDRIGALAPPVVVDCVTGPGELRGSLVAFTQDVRVMRTAMDEPTYSLGPSCPSCRSRRPFIRAVGFSSSSVMTAVIWSSA